MPLCNRGQKPRPWPTEPPGTPPDDCGTSPQGGPRPRVRGENPPASGDSKPIYRAIRKQPPIGYPLPATPDPRSTQEVLIPFVLGAADAAVTCFLPTRGSEPGVGTAAPNEPETPNTAPDEGAPGSTSTPER
jgi:hypothetical protein